MMLWWLEGSHTQLGVSQFSQCIQWYTLEYILQYKSVSNKHGCQDLWCSDGLRGPISSLESVSLVSVFSGIPWSINYSIRVYQTSMVVKIYDALMAWGTHIQLGISQFSQCIQWYTLEYILQYKSVSNKQGCQDSIMLWWLEGSHIQLGVSQFSQCIQQYTLKYILQYKSLSNKQGCQDGMMLPWLEGSHVQLGVSQFSECIQWYTLKYILQYKSLSNKQGCQDIRMLRWLEGTHVGILTFISGINTASKNFKARKFLIF